MGGEIIMSIKGELYSILLSLISGMIWEGDLTLSALPAIGPIIFDHVYPPALHCKTKSWGPPFLSLFSHVLCGEQ
jgi:hypothetical protein